MKRKVTNDARRISGSGTPPPRIRAEGARGRVSRLVHIDAPRDVLMDKGRRHFHNSNGERRELAAASCRSSCVRPGRRAARRARGEADCEVARPSPAGSRRRRGVRALRRSQTRARLMCDSASHETVRSRIWNISCLTSKLVNPAVMDEFLLVDRLVARSVANVANSVGISRAGALSTMAHREPSSASFQSRTRHRDCAEGGGSTGTPKTSAKKPRQVTRARGSSRRRASRLARPDPARGRVRPRRVERRSSRPRALRRGVAPRASRSASRVEP